MLSSCANSSCSNKFRYLHQGKLFLMKSNDKQQQISTRVNFAGRIDHVSYAWLCDECAHKFEVVLDANESIKVRPRPNLSGLTAAIVSAIGIKLAPALTFACHVGDTLA